MVAFNGTSFTTLCTHSNPSKCGVSGGEIYSMASIGNFLFVGGSFFRSGNVSAKHIAQWDGNAWSSIGSLDGFVEAMAVLDGILIVAGSFKSVHFATASGTEQARTLLPGVATYVDGVWAALGGRNAADIHSLAVVGQCVYACGNSFDEFDNFIGGTARWCASALSDADSGAVWEAIEWTGHENSLISCYSLAVV